MSEKEFTPSDAAVELEALLGQAIESDDEPLDGDDELEFSAEDSDADDMAPHEDATSQDDEEEGEPDEPIIAAPHSWDAEHKGEFNKLPRDVQEYIANKESERDNVVKQTLNQKAEATKAYDAQLSQVQGVLQHNFQNITALAAMIVPEIQALQQVDWSQLSVTDQYEYTRLKQVEADLSQKWAGLKQQHDQITQQQQLVHQDTLQKRINEQLLVAYEAIPEFNHDSNGNFKDTAKAQALNQAMQKTFKDYGFTENDGPGLYSDARMVKALARLAQLEQQEAARTAAQGKRQAPQAPRLSAPSSGSNNSNSGKGSRSYKDAMNRLSQTGNSRDAAAALAHILK